MKKLFRRIRSVIFKNRFITPVVRLNPANLFRYPGFLIDYFAYRRMSGNDQMPLEMHPRLGEKTSTTDIDGHYFYQGAWVARKISELRPREHVDVGSQADLIGFLTALTKVTFVDLRPLPVQLENLRNQRGDILRLPFANGAVSSLSCLHVAEHIGLGRYGDRLDADGTRKACAELARVLAPEGHLYFSLPVGRERTVFNAHRIHDPRTILSYFAGLELVDFSAVDDANRIVIHADPSLFATANYACGLFHFTKHRP